MDDGKASKGEGRGGKRAATFFYDRPAFSRGLGYGRVLGLCGHKRLGVRARANRVGWVGE
jgi:hypothetical protein